MTVSGGARGNRDVASEDEAAGAEISAQGTVRDQIEYMADIILELRQMAARADLGTLSGILDLALAEARQQARRIS